MTAWVVALFFAAGVAAWTYSQIVRRSGVNNPRTSLPATAAVGIIAFIVFFTILHFFL